MKSKLGILIIIFVIYLVLYSSIQALFVYYYPDALMYLTIYGIYYYFFFSVLLIAIGLNYYINPITIQNPK